MSEVTLNKRLANELVNFKVHWLQEQINQRLRKWGYSDQKSFLKAAKNGDLPESEDDAIDLTNFIDELDELKEIIKQWSSNE